MEQKELGDFWRAYNRLYNETNQLYHQVAGSCGLSDCAFWLLYTLRTEADSLTQAQLCELLSLSKQTVNSALKKLVELDYLRLEAADGNLKNKRVRLTAAGDDFLGHTVDRVTGAEDAAAAHLTEDERQTLLTLSRKLLDALWAETDGFKKRLLQENDRYVDQTL